MPVQDSVKAAPTGRASAPRGRTAAALDDAVRAPIDDAIAELTSGARTWAHLTLGQRQKLLARVRASVVATAAEWADTASTSKGLGPGHPLRGEEWLSRSEERRVGKECRSRGSPYH